MQPDGSCTKPLSLGERETLLHVPLMIHYPPMFPGGVKVNQGTEGIDLVPTLADALGVATDPEWQGTSLLPVANGVGHTTTSPVTSTLSPGTYTIASPAVFPRPRCSTFTSHPPSGTTSSSLNV